MTNMNKKLLIILTIAILLLIGLIVVAYFYWGTDEEPESPTSEKINCNEDIYNCADFTTQTEAQAVFDACETDVHQLDKDGDGVVCEGLG